MKIDEVLLNELSYSDSVDLERKLDQMFRSLGLDVEFSQHFLNRVLDPDEKGRRDSDHNSAARDTDVTADEIVDAFSELKRKHGKRLYKARNNPREFVAVLKDVSSDLNIPFSIDYDRVKRKMHELKAITLMRKKNFRTKGDEVLRV